MAEGFKSGWEPGWTARLDSLGMTQLQLVTFASIVEGEARADDERETIAGVYHNRLRIGMALQADPTVQYAIFLATGRRKPRLFEHDYQIKSPYNTYLHPGLPPGPVNSPSHRSLEASLYPAKVPYLYFVAGPDGPPRLRQDLRRAPAEHRAGAARRNRRALSRRSAPQGVQASACRSAPPRSRLAGIARMPGHHRHARTARPTHAPARPPAGRPRSRCTASPRQLRRAARTPRRRVPAPASAFVAVTRQGPIPQ